MNMIKTPHFIGIGTPKSGSTWLQMLLMSHPDVFISPKRNEIHYFDREFEKGIGWYAPFFSEAAPGQLIGEITPHYLYLPDPAIIATVPSIQKYILMYRDPVDRMVSNYKYWVQQADLKMTFREFIDTGKATDWSFYGKHLSRFVQHVPKENILVMRMEDATKHVQESKQLLADFLGLDVTKFPKEAGQATVNKGFAPKRKGLYKFAIKTSQWMLRNGLYGFRNWFKRQSGFIGFLRAGDQKKVDLAINQSELDYLKNMYQADFIVFKEMIKTFPGYGYF
jgi:Sulfotransferase domain